ncbi:MAG: ATP-binding cassette domain-containing protein, partial [Proteobacteria bacterium]|nr:ATP-binding cassette domain-containing protein [Pseudomonadota bacterium]
MPVDFTVREILAWLEILDGISSGDAGPLLDQLGLGPSLIGRRVDTLSKGERQRVVLLAVLLRRPRLILADEPLEGLDRTTRCLIGECLHRYAKEGGRSIFWVSHHLSETLQYADRLIEIEGHRLVERPTDRFAFRVSTPDGRLEDVWACSLAALPAVVAKHLVGNGTVRLEITEKRAGENRLGNAGCLPRVCCCRP